LVPEVPAAGSVGYLSHMAHIALPLIGEGNVRRRGQSVSAAAALEAAHLTPLVLAAKEGLCLVNGTPCATGLSAIALGRTERLFDWADVIAAMSFENLQGQLAAFDAQGLEMRASAGVRAVGERLRSILAGSGILLQSGGRRTQDALSLRAIPQVHGAARDLFDHAGTVVDAELESVTDNPIVVGSVDAPRAISQANAVGAALGLNADALAVGVAEMAAMAERRLDRLVNPLVSGLPAFLATDGGAGSGFMIAQYTALSLVAENRRLAAPASLDGGVTSGLQEDHLSHATPGARSSTTPSAFSPSSCWPPRRPMTCSAGRGRGQRIPMRCTGTCARESPRSGTIVRWRSTFRRRGSCWASPSRPRARPTHDMHDPRFARRPAPRYAPGASCLTGARCCGRRRPR